MNKVLTEFRAVKDYEIMRSKAGIEMTVPKAVTFQVEIKVHLGPGEIVQAVIERMFNDLENLAR